MIALLKRQSMGKSEALGNLEPVTLEQLFKMAESYGRVGLFSSKDQPAGTAYRACIEFSAPDGCLVQAASEFGLPLVEALMQAIERAEKIRSSFT